jgi:hypothetical protein
MRSASGLTCGSYLAVRASCPTCGQHYTGDMQLGLAQAHWETVRGLPVEDTNRRVEMSVLTF